MVRRTTDRKNAGIRRRGLTLQCERLESRTLLAGLTIVSGDLVPLPVEQPVAASIAVEQSNVGSIADASTPPTSVDDSEVLGPRLESPEDPTPPKGDSNTPTESHPENEPITITSPEGGGEPIDVGNDLNPRSSDDPEIKDTVLAMWVTTPVTASQTLIQATSTGAVGSSEFASEAVRVKSSATAAKIANSTAGDSFRYYSEPSDHPSSDSPSLYHDPTPTLAARRSYMAFAWVAPDQNSESTLIAHDNRDAAVHPTYAEHHSARDIQRGDPSTITAILESEFTADESERASLAIAVAIDTLAAAEAQSAAALNETSPSQSSEISALAAQTNANDEGKRGTKLDLIQTGLLYGLGAVVSLVLTGRSHQTNEFERAPVHRRPR